MASGKKTAPKNKRNLGTYLSIIGNVILWAAVLAYFIILPLYLNNGYEMVATNKYKCFREISKYAAISIGAFVVLYFSLWGMTKEEIKAYRGLKKIDISILVFLGISFISYLTSSYKKLEEPNDFGFYEGALWGTSGWFMGFMSILIFVGLYFAISRFLDYDNVIWIPIGITAIIIFAWGCLNRYQIYPVEMEFQSESMLATIGNINWMAGYQSVLAPIIMGLYFAVQKKSTKRIAMAAVFISNFMVLLNGSDSTVMSYCVMMFVFLLISLQKVEFMDRFSDLLISFSASGIVIFIIDKCFPKAKSFESIFADLFSKGALAILILIFCIAFKILINACATGLIPYPEFVKQKLWKVLLFAALGLFGLFVLLIVINTACDGKMFGGALNKFLLFNLEWGSDRGATWTIGLIEFAGLPFGKKLIGAGPDCFYFAQCDIDKAYNLSTAFFEGARLTNAHNEIITLLCNVGILGTAGFVCTAVYTIKECLNRVKDNPYMAGFVLSIVMYLANNVFSFEQITNTPFYFLVIALAGAAIVKNDREKALK